MKLRYRSAVVEASVAATRDGFLLELDEPVDAVAPGQVAVLYDDGRRRRIGSDHARRAG